jgi:signal transduction histidine kinase
MGLMSCGSPWRQIPWRSQLQRTTSAAARRLRAPLVDSVVTTLRRTPRGADLAWTTDIEQSVQVGVDAGEMTEILGNLFENAAKWAKTRVAVSADSSSGQVRVTIDDDGRGIPAVAREAVLGRGRRLDPEQPGEGLGLAIVTDVLAFYGGAFELQDAALGGLRAVITVSSADQPRGGGR